MNKQICLNGAVLDFMAERLTKQSVVVEYGAGWSSRWFADRCGKLTSIETSAIWMDRIAEDLRGAACDWRLIHTSRPDLAPVGEADLVLVDCDEDWRRACTVPGWLALKPGGWLVFDDAQRPRHAASIAWLEEQADPVRLVWRPGDIETARERLALAYCKP